ncbi:hypothetical protein WS62_03800 [Burkholderia sp. ABCPW 14]|nr:hypothetical protein WS62_03800 [Burkholderia sp. ABCPW 14]
MSMAKAVKCNAAVGSGSRSAIPGESSQVIAPETALAYLAALRQNEAQLRLRQLDALELDTARREQPATVGDSVAILPGCRFNKTCITRPTTHGWEAFMSSTSSAT